MHLFAQAALGSDAKAVSNQKHADHQLRINRWAACMAVVIRQMGADAAEINEPINRTQQVFLREVIPQ